MLINRKPRIENHVADSIGHSNHNVVRKSLRLANVQLAPMSMTTGLTLSHYWPTLLVGLLCSAAWIAVVFDAAHFLPLQAAAWLTFAGLLIGPGYLLGELLTRRLDLDGLERMALAFPIGVAILSVPGLAALLQHWRVDGLAQAWVWLTLSILIVWSLSWLWVRPRHPAAHGHLAWTWDERLLLVLIGAALLLITPVLNQHKIDGDTLAVGSFTADAMAGLPLNQVEPLFGTDLGPGVRMAFNQSLPMLYLWSYWSGIDPMTLMGSATRVMFALWSLLATYMLGKSAGVGMAGSLNGRRIGLFAVAIQLLIYMSAPFFRGDNVSLFFFERIAADKFLVPVTMLPVAFALAIRYVRLGERQTWLAGALVAFAVSAIHPLVAAMLALGVTAFGGVHLLTRWRDVNIWTAYRRTSMLAGIVVIVMALPLVQLVLARGEDPLAASYPSTFEGWSISYRMVPVLPYLYVPTLDVHGPLPDLSQIQAEEALTATDPFLVWRFAVNMERRRLILFDVDRYVSDPNIFLEPPYLLALLLLPLLFWRVRVSLGAQFAVATTAAILFVMYNPLVTPLLGGLVMPWILWRFVWMFPYALILALTLAQLLSWLAAALAGSDPRVLDRLRGGNGNRGEQANSPGSARQSISARRARWLQRYAPLALVLLVGLAMAPAMLRNLQTLQERAGFPYFFPKPERLLNRLESETARGGPATVMADADLSVTIPAYVANANIVAHRVPTTSEVFPAHRQTEALQRLIDQDAFYRARYLTADAVAILNRYDTRYVIASGGSNLDIQLRLSPAWFEPLFEDQSYTLYAVGEISPQSRLIQGNTALAQRQWSEAELHFRAELGQNPRRAAAWVGLAEIAHARGEFGEALAHLERALAAAQAHPRTGDGGDMAGSELAAVYFRMGQVLGDSGRLAESVDAFEAAARYAPDAGQFHMAVGDACLRVGRVHGTSDCAADAFALAVARQNLPDDASRRVALADIWRQRGHLDEAIAGYEAAANQANDAGCFWCVGNIAERFALPIEIAQQYTLHTGSRVHQLILVGAYQEARRYAEAEALLELLRAQQPLSPDIWRMTADVHLAQGRLDDAIDAYLHAIRILDLSGRSSTQTRLALVGAMLDPALATPRTADAQAQLDWILRIEPTNAIAHSLQGELHTRLFRAQDALAAYETAFRLDPTSLPVYFALSNHYRRLGWPQPSGAPANAEQTGSLQTPAWQGALLEGDVPELLRAALRANPHEATLALALGDQLQRRGDMAGAVESYLIALDLFEQRAATGRLNPRITGASRAYAYVQLGAVHEDLGQIARAMNFYGAAVATASDAAWAQVAYGDALRRQNQAVLAEAAYRQALRSDRTFVPAYLRLADLQMARGLMDEGSALRDQALHMVFAQMTEDALLPRPDDIRTASMAGGNPVSQRISFTSDTFDGPGSVSADSYQQSLVDDMIGALAHSQLFLDADDGSIMLNLLGRVAATPSQVDALFDLYERALAQGERMGWYPTAMSLYHKGMGDLYLTRNRPEAAIDAYEQAIALDEGWLQARLSLANALNSAGRPAEAMRALETLFDVEPGVAQVQIVLAQQYAQAGQAEEALAILSQTLSAWPGHAPTQIALAQLYEELGEWGMAEMLYRQTMALMPGVLEAHTGYAALLLDRGRDQEAEVVLAAAREIHRNDLTMHVLSAALAQRQGDSQAAAEWLARAAQLPDVAGSNLPAIADVYARLGFNQEALRILDAATVLQPDQVDSIWRTARLQRTLGQQGDALATLWAASNLELTDARLTAELAEVYLAQGRREHALVSYRQAIVLDPTHENYVLRLAELLRDQGHYDQAETVLRQALPRVSQPAVIYTALAELYLRWGQAEEAQALLRDALDALGDDPTLIVGMGVLLEAQALRSLGASDAPERWYQEALTRVGDEPDLYAALADHYLRRGQADKALAHYESALALAPARARYHLGLGAVHLARNNIDAAEAALRQAIRLEPGFVDAYYQLADLYRGQRNWDAAREVFVQAKRVAPANGEVHVRYAAFLLERGETELGMELLNKAPSISPTARTMVARASVYAKLRRTNDAIRDLQRAIAWEPGYVDAYIVLGDVLRDFGNHQAASEAYGNAIRLNPGLGLGRLRVTRAR